MGDLRSDILAYMKRETDKYDSAYYGRKCQMPTWWFKFHLSSDTKTIRRELERMEQEGLVESDHSQSNNTKWSLKV